MSDQHSHGDTYREFTEKVARAADNYSALVRGATDLAEQYRVLRSVAGNDPRLSGRVNDELWAAAWDGVNDAIAKKVAEADQIMADLYAEVRALILDDPSACTYW